MRGWLEFALGCLIAIAFAALAFLVWWKLDSRSAPISLQRAPAEEIDAVDPAPLLGSILRSDRQFVIVVNVGEDLDDLQLCMDMAWTVCEEDGEVVCGMDMAGGCWFTCCPEED